MNLIYSMQAAACLVMLAAGGIYAAFTWKGYRLRRIFSRDYVRVLQIRNAQKLYPLVPRPDSVKYKSAKRFITSLGWRISVEGIYLSKWGLFAMTFFVLVTIQTTNKIIELRQIVEDVNYNHTVIDVRVPETAENINQEKLLYGYVDASLVNSEDIYDIQKKLVYIENIKAILAKQGLSETDELNSMAQRLYYKVL